MRTDGIFFIRLAKLPIEICPTESQREGDDARERESERERERCSLFSGPFTTLIAGNKTITRSSEVMVELKCSQDLGVGCLLAG